MVKIKMEITLYIQVFIMFIEQCTIKHVSFQFYLIQYCKNEHAKTGWVLIWLITEIKNIYLNEQNIDCNLRVIKLTNDDLNIIWNI